MAMLTLKGTREPVTNPCVRAPLTPARVRLRRQRRQSGAPCLDIKRQIPAVLRLDAAQASPAHSLLCVLSPRPGGGVYAAGRGRDATRPTLQPP